MKKLPDIKPSTQVNALDLSHAMNTDQLFPISLVAPLIGMSPQFIARAIGSRNKSLTMKHVLTLLELDAFSETFVPRSKIPNYLLGAISPVSTSKLLPLKEGVTLLKAAVPNALHRIRPNSISCVVTSSPYWGMRIYEDATEIVWADGEICAFGHEQTPEGFIRHSVEVLYSLKDLMTNTGSIWWNIMDTYNTRTQIRSNAAEALNAMKGLDQRSWGDHECRRYSAGHSFLKDGELCHIPSRIAERAARIGYFVKSTITWAKTSSLPEPQNSRVSRAMETIIHLSLSRTPQFYKEAYFSLPKHLGGRNDEVEVGKVSDVWLLPTSAGRDGHGAQFPLSLPGRCIGLSTQPGELVLDPFVGSGTTGLAAVELKRKFIGIDVSSSYLKVAAKRLSTMPIS